MAGEVAAPMQWNWDWGRVLPVVLPPLPPPPPSLLLPFVAVVVVVVMVVVLFSGAVGASASWAA